MRKPEAVVRSVFDGNVFLQAMANPGGAAGVCMDRVRAGRVHLFLSAEVLAELLEVSSRPILVQKLGFTSIRTEAFIEDLLANATTLESLPHVFDHPRDPKDSVYVDLAIASNANVITTHDRHLPDTLS